MTFFYDMCKLLNFFNNEVKFCCQIFSFEWAIASFQAILNNTLQHLLVFILLFLHRHRKIFNSAEWMLMGHAFAPKLIEITHALSHWGVGRPQPQNPTLPLSLALAFPAWSIPRQLCFLGQIWGIQHRPALVECRAHHRDTTNKNPAGSFVF